MPNLRGLRFSLFLVGSIALIGILGCDEEPVLLPADQPATYGGVQFELGEYSIRYLELTDRDGETFEYPDPVLVVPLTLTNVGENDLAYNPTHGNLQKSEATTPLLFPGPDTEEINWKEFAKQPITGVTLDRGQLDEQVQRAATIAPGESLTDVFLFELPDPDSDILIFSIPPTMHRGNVPVFLRLRYQEPRPTGPALYDIGTPIEFDGVTFTVTEVEQAYIKMQDSSQGEGYSTDAILKISYTVANNSDETITFDPAHRDVSGRQGATLHSLHHNFNRARFPGSVTVEGQQGRVRIEPGESIEDFALFERIEERVELATFQLAASHFSRSGRVRVAISYEREEVEQPEEMQRGN